MNEDGLYRATAPESARPREDAGAATVPRRYVIDAYDGFVVYNDRAHLGDHILNLTEVSSTSIFAETYSELTDEALRQNEAMKALLDDAKTATDAFDDVSGSFAAQLECVAKLIRLRGTLGTERDGFLAELGGWDTHRNLDTVSGLVKSLDDALEALVTELEAQGVWGDVAIVALSDFGRTLTSNGQGTDHAWGGNMFLLGGDLKGGRILGEYPDDLTATSSVDAGGGRGRLVPTMPWESLWHAVAGWLGVDVDDEDELRDVLPNAPNFPQTTLLHAADVFHRRSLAPTLSDAPTATPAPSQAPTTPCGPHDAWNREHFDHAWENCEAECGGACLLALPPTFNLSSHLRLDADAHLLGVPGRSDLVPVDAFDDSYLIYVTDGDVTLERLRLRDWNASANVARAIYVTQGRLHVVDCVFENLELPHGVIQPQTGAEVIVSSSLFYKVRAVERAAYSYSGNGAGIRASGPALVRVEHTTFEKCSAEASGTIFAWNPRGAGVQLENATFLQNSGDGSSALYVSGTAGTFGNVTVNNSRFLDGVSADSGAIRLANVRRADIARCVFANNSGHFGGGMYASGQTDPTGSELFVVNATFLNNIATLYGGALRLSAYDATFDGVRFEGNVAETSNGGAVTASGPGTFVLRDAVLRRNVANAGGALRLNDGLTAAFERSSFAENVARSSSGGAVNFYGNDDALTALDVSNTVFRSNNASTSGGAIVAQATNATLRRCRFLDNRARGTHGGAVYRSSGGFLVADAVHFEANAAANRGGAVYATSSQSAPSAGINVTNATFLANRADDGSALASWQDAWLVRDSVFRDGVAADEAAVYLQASGAWIRGGAFSGNADTEGVDVSLRTGGRLWTYCVDAAVGAFGGDWTDQESCGPMNVTWEIPWST